jgi:hypothetical protein
MPKPIEQEKPAGGTKKDSASVWADRILRLITWMGKAETPGEVHQLKAEIETTMDENVIFPRSKMTGTNRDDASQPQR